MSTGTHPAWAGARRILCVRLDNMGDVLMTTPALHALKVSGGGRHITLLGSPSGAAVARHVPDVDEVIVYEAPWVKHDIRAHTGADLALCARLQQGRFHAAVIFTVYSQSPLPAALMCHLAGIPLRLAHCRENPYELLTDWVPEAEPGERGAPVRHEARRQLDLVASVGARASEERMRLRLPAEARARIQDLLEELGLRDERRLVLLHPGATAASRRYPPEQFAQAAAVLAARHDCRVLVTGGPDEAPLAAALCRMARQPQGVRSIAGRLGLAELAALVARARLLISNNSGPVHLASALGTPVVDLYALTNPQHTPWQVPHRVLSHDVPCRYCYRSTCPEGHNNCLRLIPPQQVVDAALELLGETRRPSGRVFPLEEVSTPRRPGGAVPLQSLQA